jgi:hypothetical protein
MGHSCRSGLPFGFTHINHNRHKQLDWLSSLISHGMSRNPGHAETDDLYEIEDIEG